MSNLILLASGNGNGNVAYIVLGAIGVIGLLALLCSGKKDDQDQKPKPKPPTHRLGQDFVQLDER